MSPELEQAIRERIDLGHSQEQIAEELRHAGYDDETINQVYQSVSNNPSGAAAIPAASLPSATDLFKSAWNTMLGRMDLVFLVALPTLVINLAGVGFEAGWFGFGSAVVISAVIGILLVIFVQFLLQLAVAHTALAGNTAPVSFATSWRWALSNIWGWVWVATIAVCVVFGGYMLLFVPGIIASVYLMFILYVYIDEGARGMSALQRSRQLVYGRFWAVVGRLIVFILFMILIGLASGVIFGFAAAALGEMVASVGAGIALALFDGFLTGVATILGVYFSVGLYQAIKTQPVIAPGPTSWYTAFGWLGAVVLAAFTIGGAYLVTTLVSGGLENALLELENDADFQAELETLSPEERAEFDAFMEQFGEELGPY